MERKVITLYEVCTVSAEGNFHIVASNLKMAKRIAVDCLGRAIQVNRYERNTENEKPVEVMTRPKNLNFINENNFNMFLLFGENYSCAFILPKEKLVRV